jgi:hypothetical protein
VQITLGAGEALLETVRSIRRVLTGGQRDDLDLEPLRRGELHAAQRCLLAGSVGVEAQEEALAETAELA